MTLGYCPRFVQGLRATSDPGFDGREKWDIKASDRAADSRPNQEAARTAHGRADAAHESAMVCIVTLRGSRVPLGAADLGDVSGPETGGSTKIRASMNRRRGNTRNGARRQTSGTTQRHNEVVDTMDLDDSVFQQNFERLALPF